MALIYDDIKVPLSANHPLAYDGQSASRYNYTIRAYRENFWGKPEDSKRPILLYFHGSGGTGPTSPDNVILKEIIRQGMMYFSCQYFGAGKSSYSPFSTGYYNVNAPRFLDLFIKTSWWVKECVDIVRTMYPENEILIYGHSMGAAAALSYAAGYTGFEPDKSIKGIVSSGATIASLGNGTWNDIWRNISVMTGIVHLVDMPTVMVHAEDDPYGPLEYAMRLQLALPANSPVYSITNVKGGHNWASANVRNTKLLVNWLTQFLTNKPITDPDGRQAVTGPAYSKLKDSCGCHHT